MPGLTGIEVARVMGARAHVIFITAFDQYAVQAFEEGAVDYLLKPLDPARLARALRRVKDRLARPPADLSGLLEQLQRGPAAERLRWITVLHGRDVQLITVEDVLYFRADNKYIAVVTADRRVTDHHATQGTHRAPRPRRVLADSSRRGRQHQRGLERAPHIGGPSRFAPAAANRDAARERGLRAPVQAHVEGAAHRPRGAALHVHPPAASIRTKLAHLRRNALAQPALLEYLSAHRRSASVPVGPLAGRWSRS